MRNSLCILLLLIFTGANAQYPIVTIDESDLGPNEPSIYINPTNVANIVAASNITNLYVSHDTGKTWAPRIMSSTFGVYGDPVIFADEYGNFYYCHLAANKTKRFPNWIDRIVVQKSNDGGENFSNGCGAGYNNDRAQDKHWISKDAQSVKFKDNIYLSWTEFDKYDSKDTNDHSRIRFARSVNGAESFEEALTISDGVGDCLDDDNTLEGATSAVGKNGEVFVAWSGQQKIYFDKSTDGGVTWGKDKVIASQEGGWSTDADWIYRTNGLPFLVTDYSRGAYSNRLYLCWGEVDTKLGGEVKIKYSDDAGETWSEEKTVHGVSDGDQFMPHIAIDKNDGTVYVVYYDRRHSASNTFLDVYVSYSEDGGVTFKDKRITPVSIIPPGKKVFFGDYNGISACNGVVRPIWTATKDGSPIVQTALLDKNSLKFGNQKVVDTTYFKMFRDKKGNQFSLVSTVKLEYDVEIILKKRPGAVKYKSFKMKGEINPETGITEAFIPVGKAKYEKTIIILKKGNTETRTEMITRMTRP